MPNRILKESICTSDTVDQMTWFEECLFHRLLVNCDDFGRMDARPAIVKAKLFPLKDRTSLRDVESALVRLADIGCVTLYECDSKPYLYLPSWEVHQNIRAKKSKYPAPDSVNAIAINCKQMQADASKCPRNPIQSNPIRIQSESNTRTSALDSVFEKFWEIYPKRVGKEAARKAFVKIPKEAHPKLIPAVEQQRGSPQWQKEDGRYIPNPATWLNQGRWDDDVTAETKYESEDYL